MQLTRNQIINFLHHYSCEDCLWNVYNVNYVCEESCEEAWNRIKDLIIFSATVTELQHLRDILMAQYFYHLNRVVNHSKTIRYTWFAFDIMHSFLESVYFRDPDLFYDELNFQDDSDEEEPVTSDEEPVIPEEPMVPGEEPLLIPENVEPPLPEGIPPPPYVSDEEAEPSTSNTNQMACRRDEYFYFGMMIASKVREIESENKKECIMYAIQQIILKGSIRHTSENAGSHLQHYPN